MIHYKLLNILLHILLNNCEKKYTRKLLGLSNVCKKLHNSVNSIVINIIKSYYLENNNNNNNSNLHINFNVLFLYYLSWCNIHDIKFLENIKKKENNKFIINILNKKLNSGRFKEYKRLKSSLYHYNLIHVIYNNSNENILMLIRLGCSCKNINNILMTIFIDYYNYYKNSLIINTNINNHLLIIRHFLIFCTSDYSRSIYDLKLNKLIDHNTLQLLDKYLNKKKLLNHLRCNYGIVL